MSVFKRFETSKRESYTGSEITSHFKQSVIGKTLVIKGRIRGSEEMLIEGKIDGHINTNHRVIIGKSGVIKADIDANEIIIKIAVFDCFHNKRRCYTIGDGVSPTCTTGGVIG